MPELPEVENVRRGLQPMLEGAVITGIRTSAVQLRFPYPAGLDERLVGRTINTVGRQAKYLTIGLDTGDILLAHLGMTGTFRKASIGDRVRGHDHFTLVLNRHDDDFELIYNDPRRFGSIGFVSAGHEHPFLRDLGPDPLLSSFTGSELATILDRRRIAIKPALLDQHAVSGLGNIYVCEALFRAGIHPTRPAGGLSPHEYDVLVDHIRAILNEAIDAGGSTLKDYRKADGTSGSFQDRFAVFDREGKSCRNCDDKIVRMTQAGRSTFFCETCQR